MGVFFFIGGVTRGGGRQPGGFVLSGGATLGRASQQLEASSRQKASAVAIALTDCDAFAPKSHSEDA
jgi:hypothetical protein